MTRKPRILLRADASHDIGFGHLARVCALGEEIVARGCEPIVMAGGDAAAIRAWARDRCAAIDVREWSATQVVHATDDPRTTAIVIDGAELATQLVPKLRDQIRAVVIDDGGKLPLSLAAVVNQNVHAPQLAATYPRARLRLLGRRYTMLRRDIRRYTRGSCKPVAHGRLRVLVTFGGSDAQNASSRLLSLIPDDRPLELVVITGPGFRDDATLAAAAKIATQRGHEVDIRRAPDDPGSLFVSADAAICCAGSTLGELAFLGCPALAYAMSPEQVIAARTQVREGLIYGGRRWSETTDDMLRADALAFMLDDAGRLQQRQRALATIDSDGARRVVEEAVLG